MVIEHRAGQIDGKRFLEAFRRSHPYTQQVIDGVNWKYIACGIGEEVLVLLPGAPGRGETCFQDILYFEPYYRIIAPDYPSRATSMQQVVHGIVKILALEGITRVHVIGGSFSGMVAQCLVRCMPAHIDKLVLSHAGVPHRTRACVYGLGYVAMRWLPFRFIQVIARKSIKHFLRDIEFQRDLWQIYFTEVVESFSRADYLARISVQRDFDQHYHFTPSDLHDWQGEMLIIEASNDPMTTSRERAHLKTFYPQATLRTFHATGHTAWANQPELYFQYIHDFLRGEAHP